MQKCPNCGQQNRPGVIFCENCGASLIGKLPLNTKALDSADIEQAELGIDASILTDVMVQGTETFEHGMGLRLEVEGSPDAIHFTPKAETIFGRRDPATGDKPDVDLTPYAGYRMGVSRRHAAIRPGDENGLDLWDLGSSNGTFLNGQRLSAHRPYRLRDGDEIRLGQMVIRLHFERESSRTPVPAPALARPETPPAPVPQAQAPANGAERPTQPTPPRPASEAAPAAPRAAEPIGKLTEEPAAAAGPERPAGEAPPAAEEKPAPAGPEQPLPPAPAAPAAGTPAEAASQPAAAPATPEAPPVEPPVAPTPEAPAPVEPPLPVEPPQPPAESAAKPAEPPQSDNDKSG